MIIIGNYCNAQKKVVNRITEKITEDEHIEIEAETFFDQELTRNRKWYITSEKKQKKIKPDPDKKHLEGVSSGAYIEVLPETFTPKTPDQVHNVNFAKMPGQLAIVKYKVNFKASGVFYVWVRGYCSSTNDNSVHVGVDDKWPNNGRALYFCEGQNSWTWSSVIRKNSDNCSDDSERAYLTIDKPGEHIIKFSMREDGFEFDKFVLTNLSDYEPK